MYRLSPGISDQEALQKLAPIFSRYNPAYPYTYHFADEQYAAKFSQELLVGKLAGVFTMLAIFISCLGLLGLAAFIASRRTKEIGIRKILGASVSNLWLLLSKDFILLVIISAIVASPFAFYFSNDWLQKYDYRISIGPGVFMLAAAIGHSHYFIDREFSRNKSSYDQPCQKFEVGIMYDR